MTLMSSYSVLIAAAGNGLRSGLSYPKTLYSIKGIPILIHQINLFSKYSNSLSIVVSPEGKNQIQECLDDSGFKAHLLIQSIPKGMGDAVLQFSSSPDFLKSDNIILVWGDIPFIQANTVTRMLDLHESNQNDFTFPTRFVDSAYTYVLRDKDYQLIEVIETREAGIDQPIPGERDMGLFVFKRDVVLEQLQIKSDMRLGKVSGEHGFLYVIKELISRGAKVEALPIATKEDLISLNYIKDVKDYA